MDLATMITRVQGDSQVSDVEYIIGKLNAAQDWVVNRVLPMNTEILKVTNDQITVSVDTQSFDLNANISTGTLYELQWLGVKFSGETIFTPVEYVNGSDPGFIYWDQQGVQAIHPQYVTTDKFNQVRFAPGLPSGTIIRADYIYKPREMSLQQRVNCELPDPFHECVVSEATSYCWRGIDDDRRGDMHGEAMDRLYGAQNVLKTRQFAQPFRTRPSSFGPGRRWVNS